MQRTATPTPSTFTTAGDVLVVGADGSIGSALVPALVAAGERVRAASRSGRSTHQGVQAVRLDLADARSIAPALEDVDRMFLVNPAENLDVTGALFPVVDAAAARGVKVVLLSVHRAGDDQSNPYRQVELRLEAAGARSVRLRPNWFADNFHTYWPTTWRAACWRCRWAWGASASSTCATLPTPHWPRCAATASMAAPSS